ncbi:hypothetical protein [Streptococcus devriesei]|uniref:hypothetical protein n=1 Tax=Streptococcus devriesei TaxID=231233 RepID=UPI000480DA00|nr:hypothetical protein [Streptococcus devriesei]
MKQNNKIDFSELERMSAFGGADRGQSQPQAVSPIVSATIKICVPTVSAVTTFLSCNKSCGWGCK